MSSLRKAIIDERVRRLPDEAIFRIKLDFSRQDGIAMTKLTF